MVAQGFAASIVEIDHGLAVLRQAVDNEQRRAEALITLQRWLDDLLVLNTEVFQPVVADALGHVATLQQTYMRLSRPDKTLRDNLTARIDSLKRRLVELRRVTKSITEGQQALTSSPTGK